MRLHNVEHEHGVKQRLVLWMIGCFSLRSPPDVVKTLLHRPEFFGGPFSDLMQDVMRGPSEWSVGERELIAAFVSVQNQCPFWTQAHGAVASYALGKDKWEAVRSDYRTAPIDERLRATLALVQKLTLDPDSATPADVEAARAAGASDQALVEALHVCALFNMIVRLADSLDFHVPAPKVAAKQGRGLFKRGYLLPGLGV
jgi:uncharacterized peroxidase-related enzyme